jgi:hypothetical protein
MHCSTLALIRALPCSSACCSVAVAWLPAADVDVSVGMEKGGLRQPQFRGSGGGEMARVWVARGGRRARTAPAPGRCGAADSPLQSIVESVGGEGPTHRSDGGGRVIAALRCGETEEEDGGEQGWPAAASSPAGWGQRWSVVQWWSVELLNLSDLLNIIGPRLC